MGSKKATQRPPSLTERPCAYPRRSSAPAQPNHQPQQAMSQRMGTIYPGAPGATGRQARARSLAEHATSNTTEEANDRCRTPDDSTAEEKHSNHNRTNIAPRQAPAWAPFTFQGLSSQLRHASRGRFVKARPARPTSTRLRPLEHANRNQAVQSSRRRKRTRDRAGASRGMIGEPWRTRRNARHPRATGAATSG